MTLISPDAVSDGDLVAAARAGEEPAWTELVDRHLRPTLAVAVAVTGCRSAAEDLCQEAFLHALLELPTLRDPDRFGSWLAGIVRRRAVHEHRVGSRRREILSEYAQARDAEEQQAARAAAETADFDDVWNAISHLPEALRVPLLLYYFEEESSAAVAERLDLPAATVRKRLQLARDRMRDRLESGWRQTTGSLRPSAALRKAVLLAFATTLATTTAASAASSAATSASATGETSTSGASTPVVSSPSKWATVVGVLLFVSGLVLFWQVDDGRSAADSQATATDSDRSDSPIGSSADAASAKPTPRPSSTPSPALHAVTPPSRTNAADGAEDAQPRVAVVTGRLTWQDGSPVQDHTLSLGESEHFWSIAPTEMTTTDDEGRFRFKVATETDCWLYLDDGTRCYCLSDSWVRPSFEEPTHVELVVADGHEWQTTVVAATTGRPIDNARVILSRPTPNEQGEALVFTDKRGQADLSMLPAGSYQVIVVHPQYTSFVGYCQIPSASFEQIEMQPSRLLNLQVQGLPEDHEGRVSLWLRRLDNSDSTAAAFAGREELAVTGIADAYGLVSLQAPPAGKWEATFYHTLDRRRFDLTIPPGHDTVVHRVHLEDGQRVNGWLAPAIAAATTEVFLAGLQGNLEQEICVTVEADGDFELTGVRPGAYLVGVRDLLGGWPIEGMTQPRWVSYVSQRVQVGEGENPTLRLGGEVNAGVQLELPAVQTRETSLLLLRVSPAGERETFFRFQFGNDGKIGSADEWGAIAITQTDELPTLSLLPPGEYCIEGALDGVSLSPMLVELTADEAATVSLRLAPQASPPSATSWIERTPFFLDDVLHLPRDKTATRQVFVPAYADFHAWHFVRSRIVPDRIVPNVAGVAVDDTTSTPRDAPTTRATH